ncbi:MAG: efflux RND transporter permease subunit, partial [Alistipes sp.]|nr:efflux RND transporter permease subunit [Alistipes sp.]
MERFFVERPVFAIALALATVLLGVISIGALSIEQYPDITPPVVEVTATYPGADAETVNDAVATPIAQSVMGVSDMLYMQTTSANDGSMSLQVTFDIGSDPDMDAVFTQNNVATATSQLPEAVVRQGVVTRKTMTGFLMVYALHSDGRYDDEFLSNYAYINIQNELLKIDGVGKVEIMGAGEYAMRIWLRPDVLEYYNISVADVSSAIATQAGIYPAGKFGAEPAPDGTTFTYTVRLPAQISTVAEFEDIVVKTTSSGGLVRLKDVADVALGSQSYGSTSSFGDKPTTVIVVYQSPGSNAVEVGSRVKDIVAKLSERVPDGIEFTPIVDTTKSIDAGIEDIFKTLVIALMLVIAIIYLFLQDWRATLIPLVAIPVSLIGTFIFFPLLGFSINIISLLGLVLAIGLVVDDAIVVVEAVQVNIERGMSSRNAAIEAMRNVASPIVATTVVLLAVFIPVSFIGGISGLLFRQFSVTIAVAVVLSAFNALTLSPALAAML